MTDYTACFKAHFRRWNWRRCLRYVCLFIFLKISTTCFGITYDVVGEVLITRHKHIYIYIYKPKLLFFSINIYGTPGGIFISFAIHWQLSLSIQALYRSAGGIKKKLQIMCNILIEFSFEYLFATSLRRYSKNRACVTTVV